MAGDKINEIPKFLADDPDEKIHAIIVDDLLNPNEPLIIPLPLKGVPNYFLSRKPKASECEDESIPHIDMTSEAPVWEPYETGFSEKEDAITDFRGEVISNETIASGRRVINYLSTSEDV